MNFKLFTGALILMGLLAMTASAQQHPNDLGVADTMYLVVTPPVISATTQDFDVELYIYNNPQSLGGAQGSFAWDNPKVTLVSVTFPDDISAAFDFSLLWRYKNRLDSSNARRMFQFVGLSANATGLPPSDVAKLTATYRFRASSWTATDGLCFSWDRRLPLTFSTPSPTVEYSQLWGGTKCVGNVITGVLQVAPTTLTFNGVAGGAAPANQSFNVTEAVGDAIAFNAATTTSWLNLTGASGTTPGSVGVGINMTGLAAGNHQGTITVSSAEATNQVPVTVNLYLAQPNRAPVLDSVGNRQVNENSLLQFTITALDPDSTIPTLSSSALPTGANFVNNGNGTGTFSWTPTYDQAGAYPVTFTASDDALTDAETITITVNNVNRPPVLAAIGPQQVNEGVLLTFGASATDPDATALTFSAAGLPTGATFTDNDNNTATFNWTPGNTDAGMHDVWLIVSDGNLADSELVSIEVVDADGFVVSPNVLNFNGRFNGSNPPAQSFNVVIGDGSGVQFYVQTMASWITLDPLVATTPANISVGVNLAGLAAGTYHDSVEVIEDIPVAAASPDAYKSVWVMVNLTVGNELVVSTNEIDMAQSEGALNPATAVFTVSEAGGAEIGFALTTAADWFTVDPMTGTTPDDILVTFDTDLAPGNYYDSIIVTSEAAVNSPLKVFVHFMVTPCPVFATPTVVFNTAIFAGETATVDQNFTVGSSSDEFPWAVVPNNFFVFDPASGTTVDDPSVHVMYSRMIDVQGVYADTARIVANHGEGSNLSCPAEMQIIVNVTVNRPPSADTVIVVNTPAVPGMRVAVPVLFTNSCQLTGLGLSLNWTAGMVLDSVSFEGSVLSYIDDVTVAINNDLADVSIVAAVGDQMLVPIGSQQLMGTLFFALPCELEEGTYGFGLGAYPPITPGDVYFYRNCGEGIETEFPEYIPGAIIVGTASNYVCGYVVDPGDNSIEGATVELWADYPMTDPLMQTHSSSIGGFAFDDIMVIPFDLYAYKEGYYPGKIEDINFGDKGIKIILTPLPEIVTPTSQWVDYFCPENPEGANWFLGAQVPVGAVVEAYTQNNLLVGQTMVIERGKYGFMPVYRAYDEAGDDGARTGDRLHFTINGMDAVASGDVIYPPDYAQVEVCLEVRGTIEKVCTLVEGWNLLSWNVNTDDDNILNVLAPIMNNVDVVLGFERGGLTFDPDLQMFSTLSMVDHLSGYWVKIEGVSQIDLTITGLPVVESTPIPLTAGWNLVSYLPEESWTVEQALASVEGITVFAYGFPDGAIQIWQPGSQFNQLETMDPCNGYWLKTNANGSLIYGLLTGAPAERPLAQELALSADGVVATTNWVNVYSRELKLDGRQVVSGTRITAYSVNGDHAVGSFTTTSAGQFGFMPVYADAAGEDMVGLKTGDQFYLTVDDVKTAEVFTWTANGDRIEVTELATSNSNTTVVPSGYSLSQNYPNPFNPSTSMSFNMPANGRAKLEIFNVLGASVAVVFDGQAIAGEHRVVWDGRDSDGNPTASGVYFYRLTADNYTETRKMMLLK